VKSIEFNGRFYNDDRMFVLYIAPCTASEDSESFSYEIFHETPPLKHIWGVVTYRNTQRYPAVKVNTFNTKKEAEQFKARIEPDCPLTSFNGNAKKFKNYEMFQSWKKEQDFQEYDYRKMYSSEGNNPSETMIMPK